MSFKTLADLASLIKKDDSILVVAEAAGKKRDFGADMDGLLSVVKDNFADLEDALGRDGKLMKLMADSGIDELDTIKDDAGKDMITRIGAAMSMINKAKKEIMGIMTELELMAASTNESKKEAALSKLAELTEGKEYGDSSEFTDEMFKVGTKIREIESIVHQPRWTSWMHHTESSLGAQVADANESFKDALDNLDKSYNMLKDEMLAAAKSVVR